MVLHRHVGVYNVNVYSRLSVKYAYTAKKKIVLSLVII